MLIVARGEAVGPHLGDAEIEELERHRTAVTAREVHVRGFDVAMDHARLVGALEAETGLRDDAQRERGVEGS